ncbi:MAG: TlpA disulfide reductase family protein [Planctomycetaceae bacterium]
MQRPASAISLTSLDGQAVEVSQFAGKVLLVDFWATNCPPCLAEFPRLKRLYRDYHPKGLEVIGISLDSSRQAVEDFQEKWQLPWPIALQGESRNGPRLRYRVETIPSMFLSDRSGKVTAFDLNGEMLRRAVAKLIEGEPVASPSPKP